MQQTQEARRAYPVYPRNRPMDSSYSALGEVPNLSVPRIGPGGGGDSGRSMAKSHFSLSSNPPSFMQMTGRGKPEIRGLKEPQGEVKGAREGANDQEFTPASRSCDKPLPPEIRDAPEKAIKELFTAMAEQSSKLSPEIWCSLCARADRLLLIMEIPHLLDLLRVLGAVGVFHSSQKCLLLKVASSIGAKMLPGLSTPLEALDVLKWSAELGLRDGVMLTTACGEGEPAATISLSRLRASQKSFSSSVSILNAISSLNLGGGRGSSKGVFDKILAEASDSVEKELQAKKRSPDELCLVSVLTFMKCMPDGSSVRSEFLKACAEADAGVLKWSPSSPKVSMKELLVARHFMILENALRLLAEKSAVHEADDRISAWLRRLQEQEKEPALVDFSVPGEGGLTEHQRDIQDVLRANMGVPVVSNSVDGPWVIPLALGNKTALEVLTEADFYIEAESELLPSSASLLQGSSQSMASGVMSHTASALSLPTQQRIRAATRLRHKMLWRRGWKVVPLHGSTWSSFMEMAVQDVNDALQRKMEVLRHVLPVDTKAK